MNTLNNLTIKLPQALKSNLIYHWLQLIINILIVDDNIFNLFILE